jgi:hypothetical protein
MEAKIRYFWCEAICAYIHSNLTNRVRTFLRNSMKLIFGIVKLWLSSYNLMVEMFTKDKSSLLCALFHLL